MGVDYYTCAACDETFADCSYYFTCSECETMFCSDKCGGKQIVKTDPDGKRYNDDTSCVMCRKEDAKPYKLLSFILAHFNMTYDQAMDLYRKDGK